MKIADKRRLVVEVAKHYLGTFYRWGGDDPDGFDCSGFVIECLRSAGVLPRKGDWTAEMLALDFGWQRLEQTVDQGDLVFWHNRAGRIIHVEICLNDYLAIGASGGGSKTTTIEKAMQHNAFIKIRPIRSRPSIWGFVNPYQI